METIARDPRVMQRMPLHTGKPAAVFGPHQMRAVVIGTAKEDVERTNWMEWGQLTTCPVIRSSFGISYSHPSRVTPETWRELSALIQP